MIEPRMYIKKCFANLVVKYGSIFGKDKIMTDKQIIIDDQKKTIHRLQDECTEKTNAIIALGEQLKRKEQEYERLKRERDSWRYQWEKRCEIGEYLSDQLDQLKAENDELKEQLTILNGEDVVVEITVEQFEEYKKLKAENEELKKKCNIYTCGICGNKEDCNKLYKTLTEIKEIAKKETQPYCETWKVDGYSEILQKISECGGNIE